MKKFIFVLIAVFFLISGANAFSVNIDPPSVWISPAPNTSYSGTIIVDNRGEEDITIRAYAEDWVFASDRSKEFKKAGTTPLSCSNWISIYPKSFTLGPGKSQQVQYTVTIPSDASGGYNSVIFFESNVESTSGSSGSKVILVGRIGSIIYANIKGKSNKAASVNQYFVSKPDENKPLSIKMVMSNDGNTILSAEGTAIVMDKEGKVYGRVNIPKFYMLPQEKAAAKAVWFGKLDEGLYDVVTSIDYGSGLPCIAEKEIGVKAGGEIKDVKLMRGKTNISSFRYVNNGNFVTTVSGRVEVRSSGGELIKTLKVSPSKVQPSSGRNYNLGWSSALKKGSYSVRIILDENGTEVSKTGDIIVP